MKYSIRKKEKNMVFVFDIDDTLCDTDGYSEKYILEFIARNYWKVLKNRLNKEGSGLVTNLSGENKREENKTKSLRVSQK